MDLLHAIDQICDGLKSANSVEKSVLTGASYPELRKRTIWTLLREKQDSSVSRTAQIST
jgi:hypothetical protein